MGHLDDARLTAAAPAPAKESCCAVLELRQYTLQPGGRDTLVALFDEHFVESQEREGMRIVGQFHDLARSDRFVWVRGFPDMETRRRALEAFYTGPVWKAHAPAANATMIAVDDVLLLKPAAEGSGFQLDPHGRPATGATTALAGLVVATIHHLRQPPETDVMRALAKDVDAAFAAAGATLRAQLVTERATNTFPRLPVREDANVLVWLASYPSRAAYERSTAARLALGTWKDRVAPRLEALTGGRAPEELLLQPTPRSLLRDSGAPAR